MRKSRYGFEYLQYTELPRRYIQHLAREAELSNEDINILTENGLSMLPLCEQNPDVLLKNELKKLLSSKAGIDARIKLVLFLHSIPGMILKSPTFIENLLIDTPFKKVPVIPISGQPCSVFHYGIQLAQHCLSWMDRDSAVMVIGMDIAHKIKDRFFFGSAMGDSIITGCISSLNIEHEILGNFTDTHIIATNGEDSPSEDIAKFRAANPTFIRNAAESCLDIAGFDLADIDWIVPHTPYKKISQIIGDMLGFPKEKIIMDYLHNTGHLNSNDSFCHYKRACKEGKIGIEQKALLVNPGFGGTRGVTILQNIGANNDYT